MKHLLLRLCSSIVLHTACLIALSPDIQQPAYAQYAPHILYAPWRNVYSSAADSKPSTTTAQEECPFCVQLTKNTDATFYILRRFEHHAVMLNKYPYSKGHLLIYPLYHQANLLDLKPTARAELMELIAHSTAIVREHLGAHGVNVGMNVGKIAGASIPSHLHFHILPRWLGDISFLEIISHTTVSSLNLLDIYTKLKPHFDALVL